MALRYGFFNSINGDRKYDALDMGSIFDGIIEDGVFATIGKIFAVTPGEGLQVIVDTGKAWFNHTWTSNDAPVPLDLPDADITLSRYDAIVLEINNEQSVRANSLKVISGAASSSPEKPILTNTDLIHQYPLAYVSISGGATSILPANIEIMVGKGECPFVTGPLETVPIDELFSKWESEFDYWFENVKTNLEGDVAANLQRQIDALKTADNINITENASEALGLDTPESVDNALKHLNLKSFTIGDILLTMRTNPGKEYLLANGDVFSEDDFPGAAEVIDPLYSHWLKHPSEDRLPSAPWTSSFSEEENKPKRNLATDGSRYCYIESATESATPGSVVLRYTSDFKTWNSKTITIQGEKASPISGGIYYSSHSKMWYIIGRFVDERTSNHEYWTWCVWGTSNFDLATWGLIGSLYTSDQGGSRMPTSHAFCLNESSAISVAESYVHWFAYSKDLSSWTNVLWGEYGGDIRSLVKLEGGYLAVISDNSIRKTEDLATAPTVVETISSGVSPFFLYDGQVYLIAGKKIRHYTSVDKYDEYDIANYEPQKNINAISAFSIGGRIGIICEGTNIAFLIGESVNKLSQSSAVSASAYNNSTIPKTDIFKNRPRLGLDFYDVAPCVPEVSVDNVYAYVRMVK